MSRIAQIRRRPALHQAIDLVSLVTAYLRTNTGTMQLRAIQAVALAELGEVGGLFCAARVGAGKTLISGLAPVMVGSTRPMLVVPAALIDKTKRNFAELRLHWRIPHMRIVSYTALGLRKNASVAPCPEHPEGKPGLLDAFRPDLLIFDEAQHLKRVKSASCARRVARYVADHPECKVVILTGTPARDSVKDFAHLIVWALRQLAPVPHDPDLIAQWAALIDDENERDTWQRPSYAILHPHLGYVNDRQEARAAFKQRLIETPGVIISEDAFTGSTLRINPVWLHAPAYLDEHWTRLRDLWVTPDDWLLADQASGVWQTAQQLALGFYYHHDPRPPTDWIEARREWCRFCRRVLETSATFDTEAQIRDACKSGALPDHAWKAWAAIKDTFVPNTVDTWLSTHALETAARWGRDGGIVWVAHRAFGRELSRATGWAYFGQKGRDARGREIDTVSDKTVIASVKSCGTGRDLQWHWSRNLFTTPSKKALDWEQWVGRTHRDGQPSPEVAADYMVGCLENLVALPCALSYAVAAEETLGQPQKILAAERTEPDLFRAVGPAYGRSSEAG